MQTHPKDSMNKPTPQQPLPQQVVPASEDLWCPHCLAENVGRVVHLWFVVDERGPHFECAQCSHSWRVSR
jgi:hypothetical protein